MHTAAPPYLEPASTTQEIHDILQGRLASLADAALTFKHAHWNVRGPGFMAAHELLDRVTDDLRAMADETAERLAALGGVPNGLTDSLASASPHPTYGIMTAPVATHFAALETVLGDVARAHRSAVPMVEGVDPVTADLLIGQLKRIEFSAWLLRSHLEPEMPDGPDMGGSS